LEENVPLWAYTFEEIERAQIEQLDVNDVPENQRLDYKRDTYPSTEGGSKEFLKDVSAFANASGGHLIIGMGEKSAAGSRLVGISESADKEIGRLENIVRTGLEPRLVGLRMKAIPARASQSAILIRVPKSWNPPHRITVGNSNRFYIRHSNGAHEMSLDELRSVFSVGASIGQRLSELREQRLKAISSGQTPVNLQGTSALVLHVVSLNSLLHQIEIDVAAAEPSFRIPPFGRVSGFNRSINFDGLISYTPFDGNGQSWRYTQLFRSGLVEGVDGALAFKDALGGLRVSLPEIDAEYIDATRTFIEVLQSLRIDGPFVVMLSLLGVRGAKYVQNQFENMPMVDRDDLLLPPVMFEGAEVKANWEQKLRASIDVLWNGFGYAKSPTFK
jgi:hypothetical protein